MDAVQRKLALIDKQLAGGFANFHKRIISTTPLLFVAVGLIAGIVIQTTLALSIWFWLVLLALGVALAAVLYLVSRISHLVKEKNLPYIVAYMTLVCFLCLGGIRLIFFYQPRPDDIQNLVGNERKLATIRGLIITEPYINKNRDWEFARFKFTDPASSFYLKMREIKSVDGWTKTAGTVRVQVAEPVLDLKAGDYIQAYCWLDRFKQATNPGQFDVARYLARKNVFIAASVKSRDGIELLESSSAGVFTKIKRRLRETATQALVGDLSPEETSRGLLEALLLGYRGNIDSRTYRAFHKTGLLHFISLSGLHLGILAGIIWWLCKIAGLMKRGRAIICIIAIVIFLLIVPPRAPTVRAAIICFVFCLSFFFHRRSNPLNTLSLAAIILLLIRPTHLFEVGWQLSFASVLGIILFTGRIEGFLYEKIMDGFWIQKILKTKLFFYIPPAVGSYLLKLLAIALAAWFGGAGFVLYHFYMINPFTSIWKLAMFPLVTLILAVGYLKIVLSFLLPSVAAVLGVMVNFLSDLLIWIVERIASLHIASWDISQILIGHVPLALIILYYCLILFAAFSYFRRPLIKKAICTVMVLLMIVFLGVLRWQRTHRKDLILTCLDVGHGQAILAQLPGGANVLFDVGSLHKSDVGRRIITPFLDYSGINKIDCIVISHNDVDHINGIPEIVEHCKVDGVYANDAFFSKIDKWGTAKFLEESISKKRLKIRTISKNLALSKRAGVKILWPNEHIGTDSELSDNDKSLVCLIEFAGAEILLCSDIERFAQRELLRLFPNLKPKVVVVPHHSSVKTLESTFLENLEADILVRSCGRRQYERQQSLRQGSNTKSFFTARDGALTVCIDKDGTIKTATRAP
ncbi:MAG: DNA internalization-related competence protein ComEC/Rec2 [Planctomycetota bacterium]